MTDINQSTLDLLDREAIRDLVVRYYDAIWRDDVETVVSFFAETGSMEVANGPLTVQNVCGHEQLRAFYRAGIAKMNPRPFCHNHTVDLLGEGRATGRCFVELRHSKDYSWISAVVYSDEYVKVGASWKFLKRRAEMMHLG
jgi:ketosteroid isomerase-like protein